MNIIQFNLVSSRLLRHLSYKNFVLPHFNFYLLRIFFLMNLSLISKQVFSRNLYIFPVHSNTSGYLSITFIFLIKDVCDGDFCPPKVSTNPYPENSFCLSLVLDPIFCVSLIFALTSSFWWTNILQ